MIETILHPTDFSQRSELAFCHALKLALLTKAGLTLLHVAEVGEKDGAGFPGVRETLERWGVLAPGSSRESVGGLGLQIKKIVTRHGDPLESTLHYLEKHPASLLVLATHSYEGKSRWLHRTVAEPLARQSREMTLFLPRDTPGFVSQNDGSLSLSNILIPIDHRPAPQRAIAAACAMAQAMGPRPVTFTLLHVRPSSNMPDVQTQDGDGWKWREVLVEEGDAVSVILQTATSVSADLIVMATAGHQGPMDALRGSTTERVVRGGRYPVLAVPAQSFEETAGAGL